MGRVLLRSGVSEARETINMVWFWSCDLSLPAGRRLVRRGEARRYDA